MKNKKIIIEIIIGLLLGGLLIFYGLKHTKTETQRKQELFEKGYTPHQIDSIIDYENQMFMNAVINAAG